MFDPMKQWMVHFDALMRYTMAALISLFGMQAIRGQNLLENGSFEEYEYCPDSWAQVDGNVLGWSTCALTPDYFNTCRSSSDFGVPANWLGYQWAADGNGYVGVITYQWNTPHVREYLCAQLDMPLTIGVPVFLSMRLAIGGYGSYPNSAEWTSKGAGMLLSTQPFEWASETPFPNGAQLYSDEVLMDTSNWVFLNTMYVPDSAYEFVNIGNFFEDSLSSIRQLDSNGGFAFAYIFVDDVCVSLEPGVCGEHNGLFQQEVREGWTAVSPFSERLDLFYGGLMRQSHRLGLMDSAGRIVSVKIVAGDQRHVEWDTSGLSDGFYCVTAFGQMVANSPLRVLKVSH